MPKFAIKLQKAREGAKLNQKTLAVRVGVSQSYISQLEQGKRIPSIDIVHKLSAAVGVEPYFLMQDVGYEEEALAKAVRGLTPNDIENVVKYIYLLKKDVSLDKP